MRAISLDELPVYSPWPARLLVPGACPSPSPRTPSRVEAEYHWGVYAGLQDAVKRDPTLTIEEVRQMALRDPTREVAMSIGPTLYAATLDRAMARSEQIHLRQLGRHLRDVRTVVDLGCGYGHLLAHFRLAHSACPAALRGADVSPFAVRVARHFGIKAEVFSFLADVCHPLENAEPPVLVTTAYALHQLPSAAPAVELLARYRDKIATVVCLEPEEDVFGSGLLGLLRYAYGKANSYSADLLRVLAARDDVLVDYRIPNAIGANALLPGTLSAWRFR